MEKKWKLASNIGFYILKKRQIEKILGILSKKKLYLI